MKNEKQIKNRMKEFEKLSAGILRGSEDPDDAETKLIAYDSAVRTLEWVLKDED